MSEHMPFESLIGGMPRWDICRKFLTTLVLTNHGNFDLKQDDEGGTGNFSVKLMDRQARMDKMQVEADELAGVVEDKKKDEKKGKDGDKKENDSKDKENAAKSNKPKEAGKVKAKASPVVGSGKKQEAKRRKILK